MKIVLRFLSYFIFVTLITSCGGGGIDNGIVPGTDPSPVIPPKGKINGSLTGRVMLGGGSDGWILNLATGDYSRIPGLESWDDKAEYLGVAQVTASPIAFDGSEVVETVQNCVNVVGQISNDNCVKIYDKRGTLLKNVTYSGRLIAGAKLSRLSTNHQSKYVVLARQYGSMTSDSYLEIHDRDGSLLSFNVIDDTYASLSFDWLPDNRLVYTFKQTIYLTSSLATEGEPLFTFTTEQGEPDKLAASPDGTQLTFLLRTSGNFATDRGNIWVINVDGTNLRQLTSVPGEDNPAVDDPAWSPDGKWILTVSGYFRGQGGNASGGPGVLYVIPSDGEKVPLTLSGSTSAKPIFSYNGKIHNIQNPKLLSDYQSSGNHAWLP